VAMVGACYGRWWLGGVLSVERGYGGVLTFGGPLSSLTSQPSSLLLWTATMAYVATIRCHGVELAAARLLLW